MNHHKHARSPLQSLAQDHEGSNLLRQAETAVQLKRTLSGFPALRGVVFHVGPIQKGNLKIFVSTPAALARIRQSIPSLVAHLQDRGLGITDIALKVQTNPVPLGPKRTAIKQAVLSPKGLQSWAALQEKLTHPDLIQATAKLNKHHQKK